MAASITISGYSLETDPAVIKAVLGNFIDWCDSVGAKATFSLPLKDYIDGYAEHIETITPPAPYVPSPITEIIKGGSIDTDHPAYKDVVEIVTRWRPLFVEGEPVPWSGKIDAIKELRRVAIGMGGCGLKEAKDIIDVFWPIEDFAEFDGSKPDDWNTF